MFSLVLSWIPVKEKPMRGYRPVVGKEQNTCGERSKGGEKVRVSQPRWGGEATGRQCARGRKQTHSRGQTDCKRLPRADRKLTTSRGAKYFKEKRRINKRGQAQEKNTQHSQLPAHPRVCPCSLRRTAERPAATSASRAAC